MSPAADAAASSEGSTCSVEDLGASGTRQLQLAVLRAKHAKCLEGLEAISSRPMSRQQTGDADSLEAITRKPGGGAVDGPMSRQQTEDASSVYGILDPGLPEPATADRLDAMRGIAKDLAELLSISIRQSRMLEGLGSVCVAGQAEVIQKTMRTLGQELQAIRSQDARAGIQALKETVEACDRISTLRLQDTRCSLDSLKDCISAQSSKIDGLKAQGQQLSLKSLNESLDAQGSRILQDLKPVCQEMIHGVSSLGEAVRAREGQLLELSSQLRSQHQEHLDEIQKLRVGLALQAQCEVVRSETESPRRQEAARKTATSNCFEDSWRLQGEAARLQQDGGVGAADPERAPGQESPRKEWTIGCLTLAVTPSPRARIAPGSRPAHDPLRLAMAAALGGFVPVVLSRLLWAVTGFASARPPAPASGRRGAPSVPPTSLQSPPLGRPASTRQLESVGRLGAAAWQKVRVGCPGVAGRLGSVGRLGASTWQKLRAIPKRSSRPQVIGA